MPLYSQQNVRARGTPMPRRRKKAADRAKNMRTVASTVDVATGLTQAQLAALEARKDAHFDIMGRHNKTVWNQVSMETDDAWIQRMEKDGTCCRCRTKMDPLEDEFGSYWFCSAGCESVVSTAEHLRAVLMELPALTVAQRGHLSKLPKDILRLHCFKQGLRESELTKVELVAQLMRKLCPEAAATVTAVADAEAATRPVAKLERRIAKRRHGKELQELKKRLNSYGIKVTPFPRSEVTFSAEARQEASRLDVELRNVESRKGIRVVTAEDVLLYVSRDLRKSWLTKNAEVLMKHIVQKKPEWIGAPQTSAKLRKTGSRHPQWVDGSRVRVVWPMEDGTWPEFAGVVRRLPGRIAEGRKRVYEVAFDDGDVRQTQLAGKVISLKPTACDLVTDEGLAALAPLTALTSLDLTNCREVTDEGLAALAPLTALTSLDLTNCREVTDEGLAALAPLTALTSSIPQTALVGGLECVADGVRLAALAPLTALTSLNLAHLVQETDDGLAGLATLTALTSLNLSENMNVTDGGLIALAPLTALTSLDLKSCKGVTDGGWAALAPLTALTSLGLEVEVTDGSLAALATFTALTSVDLKHCEQATGPPAAGF
ncbi:hypothetical protein CYMTET_48458 [Cymbomonas tetramitiformis]|uniref:F-box/LRR-repeat protein 15-like leucin rich repeat domain-containing protein n=1 Tax=Cymbomonas tetramitiformis TaxID=36881 RepID=A0AAE0EVK4_9CHLO|nr:hypothetical protein CYMTET_48458 [Cymbomonas tetramitiformis]